MSKHLKRYAAPKSWVISRKTNKWIIRPQPGTHPITHSMPIGLILKNLECAKTTREAKKIINTKTVLVYNRTVKDVHFGVGFMDSIQIKPNIALRCTLDAKGRLQFIKIPETETNKKICKITGKHSVPKGKIQLNLSDGRNILVEKSNHAVGDSVVLELPSQKVAEHLPFDKGALVFLTGGKHTATTGTIEKIEGERIWLKAGKIETLKQFAFVIGKDKPTVKL